MSKLLLEYCGLFFGHGVYLCYDYATIFIEAKHALV